MAFGANEVHLFEPTGYAGVFQHACRLGHLLREAGLSVVLHTGHEHEDVAAGEVELCTCSWWPRGDARGLRRSGGIAARFATRTVPHLRRASAGGVLHVQGIAAAGALTLFALGTARVGERRVVYSPHDTFSRRGAFDDGLLRLALRIPEAVIVHSQADVERLRARGISAHYAPLVQVVPAPNPSRRQRWREEWGATDGVDVVLFAGCIRPEKRLDLLVESAQHWPPGRRLAVVGEDRGGWERCAALARRLGVDVAERVEFVDLDDFVAALAAADVVVAPHERASQSGVLALARQLGVPTIAADVGGLGELASRSFLTENVEDLTRAIDAQLAESAPAAPPVDEELAVRAHFEAYLLQS